MQHLAAVASYDRAQPTVPDAVAAPCRGVVFVCSCAPVFRFARPAVPDFVCFDLGEVVIHNVMGGACICSVSSDSAAVVPIFSMFLSGLDLIMGAVEFL
jgi:hypothetical protein